MHLISSLLFALSANIDAFIVGMSCGIRKEHISLPENIIVSLITLFGTVLSITAGIAIAPILAPRTAQISGSVILIILGLYYIIKFLVLWLKSRHDIVVLNTDPAGSRPLETSAAAPKVLPFKDALVLAFALSINNMGMGIGASITGIKVLPTAILTFLISIMFLSLGNHLGESAFFRSARRFADPLSGIILIGLGIYELFV